MLNPYRFFDPLPAHRSAALELYEQVRDLPIVSPHGHVDPAMFSDPGRKFGNPVELLIQPDHYVLRMLVSQGLTLEELLKGRNPRQVWQIFADHFYLFRGTPSGTWLDYELEKIFGVQEKLDGNSAARIYNQLEAALNSPEYTPRTMFTKLNIEVLATTDGAADRLEHHQKLRVSGWKANIIPTFRPDAVTNLAIPNWQKNIAALEVSSDLSIHTYADFIAALEGRRNYFRSMGATATDTGPTSADTAPLSKHEAADVFDRALRGAATAQDAARFGSHMLFEMARMSADDGLVMQIHPGSFRNHNSQVFQKFGPDRGFDIPITGEFTRSLRPMLDEFGSHPNFKLILFTLDESTYSRELAPLAGAYPAVKLGPPWWFHDSWNGMRRYFDGVMETAGLYNTAGFNDDTRAFLSIPARHDVWRRASANWLAGLELRGLIDRQDAERMIVELAVGLARKAYNFEPEK